MVDARKMFIGWRKVGKGREAKAGPNRRVSRERIRKYFFQLPRVCWVLAPSLQAVS